MRVLDDPQSKLVFLSRGGPQTLMQIVKNFSDYRKLVYTVIRCIRSLSVCPQNKAALISLGEWERDKEAEGQIDR